MNFFKSNLFCLILTFIIIGILAVIGLLRQTKTVEIENHSKTLSVIIEKSGPIGVLYDTKMEGAMPYIQKASVYYDIPIEIFLGIANAESSFEYFRCYNPWGIGIGGPRCYKNWEHSVNGFAQLIRYYYLDEGLITPEQMLLKYVGWDSPYWVNNVKKYWNPLTGY